MTRSRRPTVAAIAVAVAALAALGAGAYFIVEAGKRPLAVTNTHPKTPPSTVPRTKARTSPSTPPVLPGLGHIVVCNNPLYLQSPYTYHGPAGPFASGVAGLPTFGTPGSDYPADHKALAVKPGHIDLAHYQASGTLYYFEPGTYFVAGAANPAANTSYVGGWSRGAQAVWDGRRKAPEAIEGDSAPGVTVEYLTVQNFMPPSGHTVVNDQGSGTAWTVEHTTMTENGNVRGSSDGAALQMAANDVYEYNCLSNNGQYAINAAAQGGWQDTFVNPVVSYNEISYNGISYYPDDKGCGCSGGIKFWQSWDAQFVGNYVHNNYLAGVWFDTNNTGFLVKGNYFADNYAFGVSAEISYNGDITGNTFIDNAIGNHSAAVLVNQSGGYPVPGSDYSGQFLVTNNTLINNWDGIVLFDDTGRYCGSGGDSVCTLAPRYWPQTDFSACKSKFGLVQAHTLESPPASYALLCSWSARHVSVKDNVISFNPSAVNAMAHGACMPTDRENAGYNQCGLNGEWAFISGGGWDSYLSPRQNTVRVSHFTGSQRLHLVSTSGIWQGHGEVQMATTSGAATLSFRGVYGNYLTGVRLVSGSGALVPRTKVAWVNTGCPENGSAPFTCLALSAVQMQFQSGNAWSGNAYYGPQYFAVFSGQVTTWRAWSGPLSACTSPTSDQCSGPFGEDPGGSYATSGGPFWSARPGNPPLPT